MKIRIDLGYTIYTVALQLEQSNRVNELNIIHLKERFKLHRNRPPSDHTVMLVCAPFRVRIPGVQPDGNGTHNARILQLSS